MKKSDVIPTKEYVSVSDKKVISFNPPAYGILIRNIFTGEYMITEYSRNVPISFEQAEKIIEINFS